MGVCISAGLTMWQMWQMPRASGLKGSGGTRVFAARGKRLVAAPPIRSAIDILMVTTMSLAWTALSTLSWGECIYAMIIPAESVLLCKPNSPEAAECQNSIFRPSKCGMHSAAQGACPPSLPLPPLLFKGASGSRPVSRLSL